jgi:hypothetical protein
MSSNVSMLSTQKRRQNARSEQLLKGNVAIVEADIRAGCKAYFGYPITRQTELLEQMSKRNFNLDTENKTR